MLVQKLHDATLASLSVWENQDGVQIGCHKQENSTPELNIPIVLCLKCSFYAVKIIKIIVLSLDPRVIIMRLDGDQDGCHNHNKRGVFLIKRQSTAA